MKSTVTHFSAKQFAVLLLGGILLIFPGVLGSATGAHCIFAPAAGVASAHIEASRVGVEILQQGGNAADAAVAVSMALAVVYPQAGNLGGGGFIVYRSAEGKNYVLDFRETAPAAARQDMYLDSAGAVLSAKSTLGGLAVGVPGTVRGLFRFHRRFGSLPWAKLLEPAIRLAEEGFVLNRYVSRSIRSAAAAFRKFPGSAAVFLPGGKAPEPGDRFYQKNLARSLRTIALHGERGFYRGEIAREIVKSVQMNGGILTVEDLKQYRAIEREPVVISYHDYRIITVPPPSSAGVVLAGLFNSLQTIDLGRFPFNSPQYIAFLSELEKRYFALRNQLLGDPDFIRMPLEQLYLPQFAARIVKQIDYRHPVPAAEISAQNLLGSESNQTTHFSVVDPAGNAVSMTTTLNGSFGCKLVAGSTGILLNNEMDDFAAKPGSPNMYGLVQGRANSIAPGKRMLSSMSPVVVTRHDSLIGLLGSPGGPTIITSVFQVLLNLIEHRMDLQQSVSAPRFHQQWLPDSVEVEKNRFEPAVLEKLKQWGYHIVQKNHLGDVEAIWRKQGGWSICTDYRGNGIPAGY